ncbi:DUF938 domain-containing protein [Synechococcus sp. HK01-R]|uniref:DUF938 domain-containing protein n=1 Tax=Synechococcus sp. HK01-R TaxID=2751171 RepID=UPI001623808D|nr:DUF938 domain-containing protein [Synechococcus sp. HK01-R]QNG26512.1 DUF938 domain-containing protein [Synechococcus sp. HK01-R]
MQDSRLYFPATERNREPIASTLDGWLPAEGSVLELASGSGEHAVSFQTRFPGLRWQASDPDPLHLESIRAWRAHAGLQASMPEPLRLDVRQWPWPLPADVALDLQAVVVINLLHIAPWDCAMALLAGASRLLPVGGSLIVYGPFRRHGGHTSDSNAAFDRSLRERNPLWGVRDLEAVEQLAGDSGFALEEVRPLPANNLCLLLRL